MLCSVFWLLSGCRQKRYLACQAALFIWKTVYPPLISLSLHPGFSEPLQVCYECSPSVWYGSPAQNKCIHLPLEVLSRTWFISWVMWVPNNSVQDINPGQKDQACRGSPCIYSKSCEVVGVSGECKDLISLFIKICCGETFENNIWVNPVSAVSGLIPQA